MNAARALQLAEFNQELEHHLASLDKKEHANPAQVPARLSGIRKRARSNPNE